MAKLGGRFCPSLSRGKLPESSARQLGLCWPEGGSGEKPGTSWPGPANVETEWETRSRRKELLGKARGQRNCWALHNTGREPGRAEAGQVARAGGVCFRCVQPLSGPKFSWQHKAAPCSDGGKVRVRSWDPQPHRPRATARLEGQIRGVHRDEKHLPSSVGTAASPSSAWHLLPPQAALDGGDKGT